MYVPPRYFWDKLQFGMNVFYFYYYYSNYILIPRGFST